MIPDEHKYLYYSASAEQLFGSAIYEDENGNKIKATAAVSDPNYLGTEYKWPDAKFVGIGVKFLQSNKNKNLQWI